MHELLNNRGKTALAFCIPVGNPICRSTLYRSSVTSSQSSTAGMMNTLESSCVERNMNSHRSVKGETDLQQDLTRCIPKFRFIEIWVMRTSALWKASNHARPTPPHPRPTPSRELTQRSSTCNRFLSLSSSIRNQFSSCPLRHSPLTTNHHHLETSPPKNPRANNNRLKRIRAFKTWKLLGVGDPMCLKWN